MRLNREPNNYHGVVCAFITSTEFWLHFGSASRAVMLIVLSCNETQMLTQVFRNPRGLVVQLLLVVCLVACLVWLALCLLLIPILTYVRRVQRKAVS
jgi:hypothetical protein